MATYMRVLGVLLCTLGLAGSVYCAQGVRDDEPYYRAARALERYPGNVLYTTEFKMAEPRHMLLLAGAVAAAPVGLVLGSLCLALASVLARLPPEPPGG